MSKPTIQIILGLDQVKTYNRISSDIKKIARDISKMTSSGEANPNFPQITMGLNKTATQTRISKDLNTIMKSISKNLNIDISKIDLDTNDLKKSTESANKILKEALKESVAKGIADGANDGLKSFSTTNETDNIGNRIFGEVDANDYTSALRNIEAQIKSMPDLKDGLFNITGKTFFDDESKQQLKSFTAEITKVTGETEKLNFEMAKVDGKDAFVQTSGSFNENNIKQAKEQTKEQESLLKDMLKARDSIEQTRQKALESLTKQQDSDFEKSIAQASKEQESLLKDMLKARDSIEQLKQEALENLTKQYDTDFEKNLSQASKEQDDIIASAEKSVSQDNKSLIEQENIVKELVNEWESYQTVRTQVTNTISRTQTGSDISNELNAEISSLDLLDQKLKSIQAQFSADGIDVVKDSDKQEVQEYNRLLTEFVDRLNLLKKTNQVDSGMATQEERYVKAQVALSNLNTTMQNFIKNNTNISKNSGLSASFTSLQDDMENLGKQTNYTGADVEKLNSRFSALRKEVNTLGYTGKTAFDKIRDQVEKLGIYLSGAAIAMGFVNQIQRMVDSVILLDDAMTELKKVTDETSASYDNFLVDAEQRAKTVGASLSDTITATADAARMGYSLEDSETLGDVFSLYKGVGDGITDISDASNSVISTMKAFGIEAEDSIEIIDKFNEVNILAFPIGNFRVIKAYYIS